MVTGRLSSPPKARDCLAFVDHWRVVVKKKKKKIQSGEGLQEGKTVHNLHQIASGLPSSRWLNAMVPNSSVTF